MNAREEYLVAENARLRQQLAALTSPPTALILSQRFGLSPQQGAVLTLLYQAKRPVSKNSIYAAVFEKDAGDGPNDEIVKCTISNIRRRMERVGAPGTIKVASFTSHYFLTDDLRLWISDRLEVEA